MNRPLLPFDHGEDRRLSPRTGLTRTHWERLADHLLGAVRPYTSPGQSLIHLPGPAGAAGRHSDGLEGYARTFLLAAFRLAGAGGEGVPGDLADRYASGLATGTDRTSAQAWPRVSGCDQAKVEAASVALALHETRPWIWDRLDDGVRERTVAWFREMLGARVPENNWVWFRAVVGAFLRSVGAPWSPADIARAVDLTETWHAGGGWYTDGGGPGGLRNFDHYGGWALHFYPLWYCRISGRDAQPGLARRYRERLRAYLTDLQYLVGGDGAPLHQGRSLTYRFAAAAPFWCGALFGADALPPGRTRRAGSGMLRHFLGHGCLDGRGLLTTGWHGPHPPLRQSYSGPASPYWASKGFAGLLLPPEHPVWTAVEEPLPVETGDFVRPLAAPGWTASGTRADGIVRIANHGSDHAGPRHHHSAYDPFYARWSYATATGPELGGPGPLADARGVTQPSAPDLALPGGGPLDSHVALLDAAGCPSHRPPLTRVSLRGAVAVSRHRAHWPQHPGAPDDPEFWITTGSALHGAWEVRAVRVHAGEGARPPGPLRIGGWAVADEQPPAHRRAASGTGMTVTTAAGLHSRVVALHGTLRAGVRASAGRSSFGPYSAVAYLQTPGGARAEDLYVAAVCLTRAPESLGPPPTVTVRRASVRVRWSDGHTDTLRLTAA